MNSPSRVPNHPRAATAAASRWFLSVLLMGTVALAGCDGLQFGGDTDAANADATGSTDEGPGRETSADAKVLNLPGEAQDSCVADDQGSICTFFSGEVVLRLDPGALGGPQTITLERKVFRLSGQDWVGYVWGPHGHPIDPPANVTVTIASDAVPSKDVGLTSWEPGSNPTPLPSPTFEDTKDGRYVMTGSIDKLLTTLIIEPLP